MTKWQNTGLSLHKKLFEYKRYVKYTILIYRHSWKSKIRLTITGENGQVIDIKHGQLLIKAM